MNEVLFAQMGPDSSASNIVVECDAIFQRLRTICDFIDRYKNADFIFLTFSHLHRGLLCSNKYFKEGKMTEDEIMYFVGKTVVSLEIIHPLDITGRYVLRSYMNRAILSASDMAPPSST